MNTQAHSHTDTTFRMLCPTSQVQQILHIQVPGARIRIESSSLNSDHIIAISSSKDDSLPLSPAQSALLRVFERIVICTGADVEKVVVCKLLAPNSQVGCILGKGGKIVERMRHETGAQIRVFGKDHSFSLPNSNDELIHISGSYSSVKKALISVSTCLQENPIITPPLKKNLIWEQEMVFRMLCPSEKVRGIIGKGGSTVRAFQSETGACIKVVDPVYETDEKIVVISAYENSEMKHSPAQEALLRVHAKLSENGIFVDSDSDSVFARLLVPAQQMGCLVGKGGASLQEIRKSTGANVRIFHKDMVPRCAHPNDELIQVTGGVQSVHEALVQISGRIRETIFPKKLNLNMDNINNNNIPHVGPTSTKNNDNGNSVNSGENKGSDLISDCVKTEVINIPCDYINFVYGDNGSDLFEIQQISGANITIEDPKPGEITGRVLINGKYEQIKVADSLIHGLIFCGVFNPC